MFDVQKLTISKMLYYCLFWHDNRHDNSSTDIEMLFYINQKI